MPKAADIGSKRLVSLTPTAWVRWLTGQPTLETVELIATEFQWVSRTEDVLLKVASDQIGPFLLANEIQLRPDPQMGRRLRAYASLAEERYQLPVYPVVVNILPPRGQTPVVTEYHSELLGLVAHQDFKVVNLWEEAVEVVFEQALTSLLPFVPILKGGQSETHLQRALQLLRADDQLAELEPLLAFFASFVLDTEMVQRIMRWDMAIIRESPWYQEILQEGLERGLERGLEQGLERGREEGREAALGMLRRFLAHRFGVAIDRFDADLSAFDLAAITHLSDLAFEVENLAEFEVKLAELKTQAQSDNLAPSSLE